MEDLERWKDTLKEATLYQKLDNGRVECLVCERRCRVSEGATGVCGNYVNIGGRLYHVGYGRLSAVELRPIEIKPFFHYWPNSLALTFSNWGCNFYCPWCQNWHLSFSRPPRDEVVEPEWLVERAAKEGAHGLNASFNEPATNFDYLLDVFEKGSRKGLYASVTTNGYFTEKAIEKLLEVSVDGWSIDIKGCPKMKRALASVDHEKIFRNARRVIDSGGHVEMVYLVVTNTNDFQECYEWIVGKHLDYLGPSVPLHINRYFPARVWKEPPTPVERLLRIAKYAEEQGIEYVYVGNLGERGMETTFCPRCKEVLLVRRFYRVVYHKLDRVEGKYFCPRCGHRVPIKGSVIERYATFLISL